MHTQPVLKLLAAISFTAVLAGCAGGPGAPLPDYAAIVAAPDRSEADRLNDQRRKPVNSSALRKRVPG